MPSKIDLVNGHLDLLAAIVQFAAGWPDIGTITKTLTGNPDLRYVRSLALATPLETWTVTCTTAGGDGVAIFSVTGSTSGAQAAATAGTQYNNGIISFKITGPALYNCVLGDQFQFTFATGAMTTAAIPWVIDRYTGAFTNDAELIMHGIGAGTDTIYAGYKSKYDVGQDIFNLGLNGYTAYQAGSLWEEQPGAIPIRGFGGVSSIADIYIPGIGFAKEPQEGRLYISGSSRVIRGCLFFGGYSAPFYTGLMLPYYTPNQWEYPLMIAGSMGGEQLLRFSSAEVENSAWFMPTVSGSYKYNNDQKSSLRIIDPSANWAGFKNGLSRAFADTYPTINDGKPASTWPYVARNFEDVAKNIDGSYPLFPIYMLNHHDNPATSNVGLIFGVPDGCYAISGADNAQENTFTIGSDNYVVCRNGNFSEVWDYMAMRLDA